MFSGGRLATGSAASGAADSTGSQPAIFMRGDTVGPNNGCRRSCARSALAPSFTKRRDQAIITDEQILPRYTHHLLSL